MSWVTHISRPTCMWVALVVRKLKLEYLNNYLWMTISFVKWIIKFCQKLWDAWNVYVSRVNCNVEPVFFLIKWILYTFINRLQLKRFNSLNCFSMDLHLVPVTSDLISWKLRLMNYWFFFEEIINIKIHNINV